MGTETTIPPNPKEAAHNLRSKVVDVNSTRPTPVVAAAEELGFTVKEFSPTDKTRGISGAINHSEKVIYVNEQDSPQRRRFTIAHELGHAVLHKNDPSFVDYRHDMNYGDLDRPKEREANEFAAELLMPRNVFEALWNAYEGEIKNVADQLQVSKDAAHVRASKLRLTR